MAIELVLSIPLIISVSTACTYYAERHPEPPFKEVARYPLGICTATHYAHNTIPQESVMYLCGADNTHIIKYTYTDASNCAGEYTASIATRNPNDFVCDNNQETCPYIVVKVHNKHYGSHDWRKWYSSTWVTNTCQNGELYSCDDNTQYTLNQFENENCDDLPTQATTYSAAQYLDDTDAAAATLSYDIFCNEPDPMTAVLNFPDNSMFISTGHISWSGDSSLTKSIETAVCLTGRSEGQHKEIGDALVSYCFVGYDDVYSKPIYRGMAGEIRWTDTAKNDYGGAFGLFLYEPSDTLGLKYPMAYCFSGESKDISVCSKRWYVDHGTSARYYMDENMGMNECECSVDLSAEFHFSPPSIPNAPDTTAAGHHDHEHGSETTASDGAAMKSGHEGEENGVLWVGVRNAMYIGVIGFVFGIGL